MASRVFWLFVAGSALVAVVAALVLLEDTADVKEKQTVSYRPPVSVVDMKPGAHRGVLRSFAEVKPRWSTDIKAHISGEVITMTPQAMAGESVLAGDLLVRIENSRYKADLDQAKYNLAQAKLQLQLDEKKAKRALADWKRSGIQESPSDMALHKPQLDLARRALDAAQSAVQAAQQDYSYTEVKAPFSGVAAKRYVSIGQTVNPGDPLVQLLEEKMLDIEVSLSPKQWENLDSAWRGAQVPVKDDQGRHIATARMIRGGGFLDPQTRQYTLFLQISDAKSMKVLPGEFVYLELPGREVANTGRIPESAFTREGLVWYVDAQNRLRFFASEVLFYREDMLVISLPEQLATAERLSIVLTPLASFIAGREVTPVHGDQTEPDKGNK